MCPAGCLETFQHWVLPELRRNERVGGLVVMDTPVHSDINPCPCGGQSPRLRQVSTGRTPCRTVQEVRDPDHRRGGRVHGPAHESPCVSELLGLRTPPNSGPFPATVKRTQGTLGQCVGKSGVPSEPYVSCVPTPTSPHTDVCEDVCREDGNRTGVSSPTTTLVVDPPSLPFVPPFINVK